MEEVEILLLQPKMALSLVQGIGVAWQGSSKGSHLLGSWAWESTCRSDMSM